MRTRLAATLTAALGFLVLLPIVVVVALGTYGAAIGGSARSEGDSGAELTIVPGEGIPGSVVRVEGRKWPPRSDVSLWVSRGGADRSDRQSRVARVTASRNGTFVTEIAVPAAIVGPRTKSLLIEARAGSSERGVTGLSVVGFKIAPYPNEVRVIVTDSETGAALPETMIEIRDLFGVPIASGSTNDNGDVTFANLRPGMLRLEGRKLDYLRERVEIEAPDSGNADVAVSLAPAPRRRLFMPHVFPMAGGTLRVAGVDLASGLRSDLMLVRPVPAAWLPETPDGPYFNYFFLISDGPGSSGEQSRSSAAQLLNTTLEFSARTGLAYGRGPYGNMVFAGQSSSGEAVLMIQPFGTVPESHVIAIDVGTNEVRSFRTYLGRNLAPSVSREGNHFYFLHIARGRLERVSLSTGEVARFSGLPEGTFRFGADPAGRFVFVLTVTGSVHRMDLESGLVEDELFSVKGAESIAMSRHGSEILLTGPELGAIAIADLADGGSVGMIPVSASTDWVWADSDGPFILVGGTRRPEVTVIDAESLNIVAHIDFSVPAGSPHTGSS